MSCDATNKLEKRSFAFCIFCSFCEQLKEERQRSLLTPFLPYFISHLCDMASDSQDILLFTVLDCLQQVCQVKSCSYNVVHSVISSTFLSPFRYTLIVLHTFTHKCVLHSYAVTHPFFCGSSELPSHTCSCKN